MDERQEAARLGALSAFNFQRRLSRASMSSQAEAAGAEEIEMEETGSPSSAVPRTFPSVKVDAPLVDSYTFHSVDAESATESLKGKERAEVEGEWMLGVDEAGRGPVLGEHGIRNASRRACAS